MPTNVYCHVSICRDSEVAIASGSDARNSHLTSRSGQLYHMFSANANGVIRHVLFPVASGEPQSSLTNKSAPIDMTKGKVNVTRNAGVSQGGTRVVILPATSRMPQRSMICKPILDFSSLCAAKTTTEAAPDRKSATWTALACNFNLTPPCYVTSGRSVTVLASSRSLAPTCRCTAVVQKVKRSTLASASSSNATWKSSIRPKAILPKATPVTADRQHTQVIQGNSSSNCAPVVTRKCSVSQTDVGGLGERRMLCPKQNIQASKVSKVGNAVEISTKGAPRRCAVRSNILRGDDMQVRIAHRVAMDMRIGLPSGGALWNVRKVRRGGGDGCIGLWNQPPTNLVEHWAKSQEMVVRELTAARSRATAANDRDATSVGDGAVRLSLAQEVSAEMHQQLIRRRMSTLSCLGSRSVSSVIMRLSEQEKKPLSRDDHANAPTPCSFTSSTAASSHEPVASTVGATPADTRLVCGENETTSKSSLGRANRPASVAIKRKTSA